MDVGVGKWYCSSIDNNVHCSDKHYQLTLEHRDDYLYALIEADFMTVVIAMEYLNEVHSRAVSLVMPPIMIERKVPNILSQIELFWFTSDFVPKMRQTRVAFVEPNLSHIKELEFASLVAKNRGVKLSFHSTIEAAEAWLRA